MYEIPFFLSLLNHAFIAVIDTTITANLVVCESTIPTGVNGCAHNIFEVKSLNANLPVPRGRLVCVYPYF